MFKKQFIFLMFLLTAVAVISGCKTKSVDENTQEPALATSTESSEVATTTDNSIFASTTGEIDSSDWLTYENRAMGIHLKYPKTMIELIEDKKLIRLHQDCEQYKDEDLAIRMKCDLQSDITINIVEKNLEEFIETYKSDCQSDGFCFNRIVSQADYYVGDKKAKILKGADAEGVGFYIIFISNNNTNYAISYIVLNDIYKKVISTIEFTL